MRRIGRLDTRLCLNIGMALAFQLMGCASDVATITEEEPIIGGTIDSGDQSVVALQIHSTLLPNGGLCSGAVISPRIVLTAAHASIRKRRATTRPLRC